MLLSSPATPLPRGFLLLHNTRNKTVQSAPGRTRPIKHPDRSHSAHLPYEIRLTVTLPLPRRSASVSSSTRAILRGNQRQQIHKLRAREIDQHLPMRIVTPRAPPGSPCSRQWTYIRAACRRITGVSSAPSMVIVDEAAYCLPGIVPRVQNSVADVGGRCADRYAEMTIVDMRDA
jgi:hypothetical protein